MGSPTDRIVLDHVAHAVVRWQDAWARYAVDLGARWASGVSDGAGFSPAQLRFGNGARLELLMPSRTESNDFLARFLDRHGPGAHHVTFKVPDLDRAIDAARTAGLTPIGIQRSDPAWQEAFLSPRQATGVVVQLAQAAGDWVTEAPEDFPTSARTFSDGTPVPPAHLDLVVHAVARLDEGLALFAGLLGGTEVGRGEEDGVVWAELRWSGPLGLRLVAPADDGLTNPLASWIGGRSGRIHHLHLTAAEPDSVTGARPSGLPSVLSSPPLSAPLASSVAPGSPRLDRSPSSASPLEVPPEANLGLRLVLTQAEP